MKIIKKIKITEIQQQKRNKNRYTIKFNDNSFLGVSENFIISHDLFKDKEITVDQKNSLVESESYQKVKNNALNLLSYRMRSKKELINRLMAKSYDEIDIENVISELSDYGYINDLDFGLAFSKDKIRSSKLGPIALRLKLREHISSDDLLSNIITQIYTKEKITSLLKILIRKRKKTIVDNKSINKLIQYLTRKGFSYDDIKSVIEMENISYDF